MITSYADIHGLERVSKFIGHQSKEVTGIYYKVETSTAFSNLFGELDDAAIDRHDQWMPKRWLIEHGRWKGSGR